MKKAVRVYIFGIVQGVLFRDFIKGRAEELNLKGYARNKEDGSVELWLEGDSSDVDKMVEVCKKGPKHAIIKRLDIVDENFQDMKEFKIIRF
ncbi:MAG: acylphosphatase [Nanoarchaeota archaeon]